MWEIKLKYDVNSKKKDDRACVEARKDNSASMTTSASVNHTMHHDFSINMKPYMQNWIPQNEL